MLQFQDCRIMQSLERPVALGATITAEGQALVATSVNGVFGVAPSTGSAGEKFAGVALSQQLTPLALPNIENQTVAALAVTAFYLPIAGTLLVRNTTRGVVLVAGVAAGNYGIVGSTITVVTGGATLNGDVLELYYRYSPTTSQVRAIQGDIPAGGAAGLTLNSVGVIVQGDIATTEFDTSVDWTVANPSVALSANGLFTIGGAGTVVPNAYITMVPAAGVQTNVLGLHFAV